MTPRERLEDVARERAINPSGLDDREVALCVLTSYRVDIEQPAAPLVGDFVAIREHDEHYLVARAIRTARFPW